jgi:hypothetical protein
MITYVIGKELEGDKMAKVPTSFSDLNKDELIRSAVEDFALELSDDEKKGKNTILAAFAEANLVWDDYVSQHPEVAPEPEPVVVTSNAPKHNAVGEDTVEGLVTVPADVEPEDETTGEIITAQPVVSAPSDQFLLKMTRENPVFQTRGYEFTEDHPYALVTAKDAMWILENEDGFRQAYPQELEEFYG